MKIIVPWESTDVRTEGGVEEATAATHIAANDSRADEARALLGWLAAANDDSPWQRQYGGTVRELGMVPDEARRADVYEVELID